MKTATIKRLAGSCFIGVIGAFFFSTCAFARDITLTPSIRFKQEYNDNILFTRTNEIDDYISYIIPALKIRQKTEVLDISALAEGNFFFYADESQLNDINQRYRLDGRYKLTERWSVKGRGFYLKDTTLNSQLRETGTVGFRQRRERVDAGGGLGYRMSERSNMDFDYRYIQTNFQRPSSVDTEFHQTYLSYSRRLKNERDVISVIPEFTYGTSDAWDVYNYNFDVRWQHPFSETLDLFFQVGARGTQQKFKYDRDNSNTLGGVADIRLRKRGETTSGLIGFRQRLLPDSDGQIRNISRLYCDVRRSVYQRLGIALVGSVYYSRLEEKDPLFDDDRWYFEITPSVFYRLAENYRVSMVYSYSQEHDLNIDRNPRKDRQRVWISLDMAFPKKW